MARHLANSVRGVDYYFFKSTDIRLRQKEFLRLVSSMDIVHWLANLSWTRLPQGMEIQNLPVPNIAAIHHVDESLTGDGEIEEKTKIEAASSADVIQVESLEWVDFVRSRTNTPVFLAHQAINPMQFYRNRNEIRPRKPFQIGTFGYAKEQRDRKRMDVLLESLVILKKQNYDFELVVQGPNWTKLQDFFLQKGIIVKNLGYLSTTRALKSYRLIDLYVCSSDVEGGPLPVLESLASGVPVVSTKVGVAIEALAKGGGILVDKGNPQQLASAIASVMDDHSLYEQLSSKAPQIAEHFSWDKIGHEYLSMYEFAVNLRKPNRRRNVTIEPARIQRTIQLSKQRLGESQIIKKIFKIKHLIGEQYRKML